MPALDTDIVVHRVPLVEGCKPFKQKLRRTHPEVLIKVNAKIKKLWNVGFLEVVKYPQWVSNIVVARKTIFHLPRIEMLVDNAAYNSTYFDGFPGYNQIKMA
jgi:hypothetical protein